MTFTQLYRTSNFVIPANPGSVSEAGTGIHPTAVIPAPAPFLIRGKPDVLSLLFAPFDKGGNGGFLIVE
jgi:hypothetical protein